MNAALLEMDTVSHQKIVFCLDTITQLDRDTFLSLASHKADNNAADLFIIDIARCLLTGDVQALRQLVGRSGFIKQPYLVLLKRACQYLCAERAQDVIKTVVELEATGISNPLCYVLAAEAQAMNHQYTEAFHNFSTASNLFACHEHLIIRSRHCLQHIEATRYSLALEKGAIEYLQDQRFDSAIIAPLASSLIKYKYQLDNRAQTNILDASRYDDVKQDVFFLEILKRALLPDPDIELFLIQLRKHLLDTFAQTEKLALADAAVLCALALQNDLNEHVHFVSTNESNAVNLIHEKIKDTLNKPSATAKQLATQVLLTSLYEPLSEQPYCAQLLNYAINDWPTDIQPCLERILYQHEEELEFANAIQPLTTINNAVSLLVGSQYEANPYPRWHDISKLENSAGYAKHNGINKPPFIKAKHFDKPLKILIAGCGTGKHPIALALKFPNVHITAIDLSRRSLAYATMKATQLNLSNIRFYQADILELSDLKDRFNVIECMGVLHHMQDPIAGLQILKGLLVKNGVMKLGLYSEIARKEIAGFREENSREGTKAAIRQMRHEVIAAQREKYDNCLKSNDFYSTSMCRDLLFHAQEHTFTLTELETILTKNELLFKGFTFNTAETFHKFTLSHGSHTKMLDLRAWHQFETRNPQTFAGMYQFFTQIYS
ncbi:class I SAM-dependent methyltransferase [Simiduia curdlanivorans]|uniref:Class I SAM-dependent methyltransferase n=1 Tax=Simiduia curdlanivorans TaxID=1492769 RepID=A0ABV8V9V3_9GAMM|nr:class I SAM-dependent methyltransferase [Simiduia curdlanivorans]MDN3639383.1 class I SAM-dependent methyltransferase [Simiduia curdlanivorans]